MSGRTVAVVLAAVALAVLATWPLASCPSTCVVDAEAYQPGFIGAAFRRDVDLVIWILAWGAHALTTNPLGLFDANVFHPAPLALTTTEHLLGLQPVYLPLAFATGDPVLAHQVVLIATFAGAFLAAFAAVRVWTGSTPAAATAGILYAYSPLRASYLAALHVETAWLLPLVLLAVERVLARGSRRTALALGVLLAWQALQSYYVGYAAFLATGVLAAVAVASGAPARRAARRLVTPVAVAALVVAVVSIPYLLVRLRGDGPAAEPLVVEWASAKPGRTGASLAVALALSTLPWWRRALRADVDRRWPVALAVMGAVLHLLALGPEVHLGAWTIPGPFALLTAIVPGFDLVRGPVRLNVATTAAAALLAGLGVAGLVARAAAVSPRRARAAGAASVALAFASVPLTMPWPIPLRRLQPPAPVVAWLARAPRGAVLEVPFHEFAPAARDLEVEAARMRASVGHWQPLLGGYGGYAPSTYPAVSALVRLLPDARALAMLVRTTGLRWVVVHRAELRGAERRRWARDRGGLQAVAVLGPDVVLVPRERATADLEPAFVGHRDATALGTPLASVAPDAHRAEVVFDPPPAHGPLLLTYDVAVRVTNRGAATWPALARRSAHVVTLAARWLDAQGRVRPAPATFPHLPWDVASAETIRARPLLASPQGRPPRALVVGVAQDGVWFEGVALRCFDALGAGAPCPPALVAAAGAPRE